MEASLSLFFSLKEHSFHIIEVNMVPLEDKLLIVGKRILSSEEDFSKLPSLRPHQILIANNVLLPAEAQENFSNYLYVKEEKISGGIKQEGTIIPITCLQIKGIPYGHFVPDTITLNPSDIRNYDRQIRCLGTRRQEILSTLHIGIVGCGGIGSSVAEQLTRLGIQKFTLIDDDHVMQSNISRMYGTKESDYKENTLKVDILKAHLEKINTSIDLTSIPSKLFYVDCVDALKGCDFIFSCTDDWIGRVLAERIGCYYNIPIFMGGVLIKNSSEQIEEVYGKVTLLTSQGACLWCRNHLQSDELYKQVVRYVVEHNHSFGGYYYEPLPIEPSVINYTTGVAAHMISLFLDYISGDVLNNDEFIIRFKAHQILANPIKPCACALNEERGSGNLNPPLGILWPKNTKLTRRKF